MRKFFGVLGIIACITLLILVGVQVISWFMFWVYLAVVAFFAYFMLPRLP